MEHVREALRQVVLGQDFMPAEELLRTVKPKAAVEVLEGSPYSIATNVAHADIWNRLWLAQLKGEPKFNPWPDFPPVSEEEWPKVRDRFLENLRAALELAEAEPFVHKRRSDAIAARTLLQIAVHTAYHLGQIRLLKRMQYARSRRGKGKSEG